MHARQRNDSSVTRFPRARPHHPWGLRLAAPLLTALLALTAGAPARAVSVVYVPVDLVDSVAGRDLWRYDYTVQGDFNAFDSVVLSFSDSLYDPASLALSSPPDVLDGTTPIVPALPGTSSLLYLTALAAAPALTDHTSVEFVWIGVGTPTGQPFAIVSEQGATLQSGFTASAVTAVPEPAGWLLGLMGLASVLRCSRRRPTPAEAPLPTLRRSQAA